MSLFPKFPYGKSCTDTGGDLRTAFEVRVGERAAYYGENYLGYIFCGFSGEFQDTCKSVLAEFRMAELVVCIGIGGVQTDGNAVRKSAEGGSGVFLHDEGSMPVCADADGGVGAFPDDLAGREHIVKAAGRFAETAEDDFGEHIQIVGRYFGDDFLKCGFTLQAQIDERPACRRFTNAEFTSVRTVICYIDIQIVFYNVSYNHVSSGSRAGCGNFSWGNLF